MKLIQALGIVCLVALLAGTAHANNKAVKAVRKKEAAATKKCIATLLKSAKALAGMKAYDEARGEIRVALHLDPSHAKAAKELVKLRKKTDETPEAVEEKAEAAIEKAHTACSDLFVPVLDAWAKAEWPEELAQLATVAVTHLDDEPFEALDLTWFDPYLLWARSVDVERWEKGDEFWDGAWVSADDVKKLDEAHAKWSDPWLVDDGVQQVKTTMSLRDAKRVSHYVRSFRAFVIDYFHGEWAWTQPNELLPIFLTRTQVDYTARLTDYDPGSARSKASALYVQRTGGICPVFLTFEPKSVATGTNIGWVSILRDVRHEVAHQLLYESAMADGAGVGGNIDWVSEGIATFLGSHQPSKSGWRLKRLAQEPYGTGFEPGPFAWTMGNLDSVGPLETYFAEFKPNLNEVHEYWVATTLTYFLLHGGDRAYRKPMMQLLIDVHMARGDKDSFAKHFGKVDFATMQRQWEKFVKGISIQDL